jgi:tetratricopeptide (TPR) repeat protein
VHRPCGIQRAAGFLLTLLLCSVTSPVAAQSGVEPTPEQVRAAAEAFDLGRQSYKAGRYTEAAEQFERADASAPSSTALELAIRARDKAGDLDRAGTLASLALTLYPNDENIGKIAPDVITRAGADLYELSVTCTEPCEITDGTKVVHGRAASSRTLFLAAGTHQLRASFGGGRTESKSVEATPGASGSVDFAPESTEEPEAKEEPVQEAPPEPPPPEEEPEVKKGLPPMLFWVGAGATVAAGGVTVWSGLDTVNNPGADRVKAECQAGDENCKLYQEGRAKQTRTNILLGVTGVFAVATGVLAAVVDWGPPSLPSADEGQARPRVSPWFAWSNGPSLGARGSF